LVKFLTPDFLPLLKGLKGLIIEESSYLSPPQIKSMEPAIATITEVPDAFTTLEEGFTVTMHGDESVIYEGVMPRG
jgi:phosphohistidine swiveling domain-containing protein